MGEKKSPEAIMCEINNAIENMVRLHPEQWLWLHDRWKVKPPNNNQLGRDLSRVEAAV
jgi:lauroyl/myristoyl acyltransferase